MPKVDVIGRGVAFPFSFTERSGGLKPIQVLSEASGIDKIRMSISQILGTDRESRIMRRDFGSLLRKLVFMPIDPNLELLVSHYIRDAIEKYEKRIEVGDTRISLDQKDRGRLLIEITFKIRQTQEVGNLVYPFYTSGSQQEGVV